MAAFIDLPITVKGGSGSIELWFDLNANSIAGVQGQMRLHDLKWHLPTTRKQQHIPSFFANVAWKPTTEGWQFSADQMQLTLDKTVWPTNQVQLQFDKNTTVILYLSNPYL